MSFLTGVLRGGWLFLPLSSMWPYCILSYSWFILCNSFIGLHLLFGRVSVGLHNLICIYCVLTSSTAPNCNKSPLKYLWVPSFELNNFEDSLKGHHIVVCIYIQQFILLYNILFINSLFMKRIKIIQWNKQFKLGICIYKYMNKSKPLSYFAKVFTQWTL